MTPVSTEEEVAVPAVVGSWYPVATKRLFRPPIPVTASPSVGPLLFPEEEGEEEPALASSRPTLFFAVSIHRLVLFGATPVLLVEEEEEDVDFFAPPAALADLAAFSFASCCFALAFANRPSARLTRRSASAAARVTDGAATPASRMDRKKEKMVPATPCIIEAYI